MKLLNEIVVVVHLLGMAAIVGAWFAVRSDKRLVPAMLWGARVQIITGLILMAIAEMDRDDPPNRAKLGVKLLIALIVLVMTETANARQRRAVSGGGSTTSGVGTRVDVAAYLAILNVAIAVLWRSYS
ncbi:MAG: hypothetical protein WAR57_15035 [Candidatus Phosphoribacter sp.]|nr:hypothetical protein [Actinomycetales bacterium]